MSHTMLRWADFQVPCLHAIYRSAPRLSCSLDGAPASATTQICSTTNCNLFESVIAWTQTKNCTRFSQRSGPIYFVWCYTHWAQEVEPLTGPGRFPVWASLWVDMVGLLISNGTTRITIYISLLYLLAKYSYIGTAHNLLRRKLIGYWKSLHIWSPF